jgi:hypothetical protein
MPRDPVMFNLPKNYLSMGVRDWAGLLMDVTAVEHIGKIPPVFSRQGYVVIRGSKCMVCDNVKFNTFKDMNDHVGKDDHQRRRSQWMKLFRNAGGRL